METSRTIGDVRELRIDEAINVGIIKKQVLEVRIQRPKIRCRSAGDHRQIYDLPV